MAGERVPDVRIGAVLWPSWNLTVAMPDKEEFVVDDIVKLSSSDDSELRGFWLWMGGGGFWLWMGGGGVRRGLSWR